MLDFPSSPAANAEFNPGGGVGTFIYQTPAWRRRSGWVKIAVGPPAGVTDHYIALPAGYRLFKLLLNGFCPVDDAAGSRYIILHFMDTPSTFVTSYVYSGMWAHVSSSGYYNDITSGDTLIYLAAHPIPNTTIGINFGEIDIDPGGGQGVTGDHPSINSVMSTHLYAVGQCITNLWGYGNSSVRMQFVRVTGNLGGLNIANYCLLGLR